MKCRNCGSTSSNDMIQCRECNPVLDFYPKRITKPVKTNKYLGGGTIAAEKYVKMIVKLSQKFTNKQLARELKLNSYTVCDIIHKPKKKMNQMRAKMIEELYNTHKTELERI